MAPRSKVDTLPPELKAWLDAEMIRRGFGDYVQLAADLLAKGADVSKSALHRYGSKFELRMAQLRRSTEQATALVDANPDDEGKLNEAVIRLAQDKIFSLLVQMDIDPDDVDINKLFKSAAEIGKASVLQKRNQVDMRERLNAALAKVEAESKANGEMSALAALKRVREEAYGIYKD